MFRGLAIRNSLFFRIFIGYVVVILLFAVFNIGAFTFFKSTIQSEIIQYNRLMLKNTAERYGTHFTRIKNLLFDYTSEEDVIGFNRQLLTRAPQDVDYLQAKKIIANLRRDIYNPLFYLDDMIIHYKSASFTVGKDGSSDAEEIFSRLYTSDVYNYSFWNDRFAQPAYFQLLPSAVFYKVADRSERKELIPFAFRLTNSNYQVIAFIDVAKTQSAFFGTDDKRQFMIMNKEGTVIYRSSDRLSSAALPAFDADSNFTLRDGQYYFRETDEDGLVYVTIVPYASIASQVEKVNLTLLFIFVLTLGIGLAASFYSSKRVHSPIKQLITAITDRDPLRQPSRIREVDFIQSKLHDLMQERDAVQQQLTHNKSVLTSYSYINKLKSINSDISVWQDFIHAEESFTIVLYRLTFRRATFEKLQLQEDRAATYIREHIDLMMEGRFPGSHTFQMENNEILSVIVGNDAANALQELLLMLKQQLDHDKEYCLVSIAVSSPYRASSQFNDAYRQVQELARQARLIEETQLIRQPRPLASTFALSPSQDQELNACIQAADAAGALQLIERTLLDMQQKEASVGQFQFFADAMCSKIWKFIEIFKIEPEQAQKLQPLVEQFKQCCTVTEYTEQFERLMTEAVFLIQDKKEEADPIVSYVMEVLHTKYVEDISLDYLADKLNMSNAYLSVYIKEKTGVNFIDHLNDIRIGKARELLIGTDLSIQDISVRSGYRNITSFNRMFKKWTGMTPGEYRRNHAAETL
ncbi:HTH-type transcriptional activator RhaR [Paenibacillus solanacearum]|uniref:HTH-type transcriptional activator RhaR n=1 Tax=Paenibacillus solanacearum TaxID=2048548 RepID=A0A916K5N7_9BACL|nr:helix-turn-helix domain-containing protein [Paenibacillus solanacearum]CAG7629900.1 HTH-type transcriptional activator RhaR [Paenibacillus solanacearum]